MKLFQKNLVLALAILSSANAFAPVPFAGSATSNTVRFVSTEPTATDEKKATTETAASELQPEFEAVRAMLVSKMSSSESVNPALIEPLSYFIREYVTAMDNANKDGVEISPEDTAKKVGAALEFGLKFGMGEKKYKFGLAHDAMREPFDYYAWGCDFFRPAMNMKQSVFLGEDNLKKAMEQLEAGENVVFLANHQSEADPQVVSIAFEEMGFAQLGADLRYVAGHKVTTDALAIPFSMGRNLLCIHSKKHINADPETKGEKSKQNMMTMSSMLDKLKVGGTALWVAPSGGRDRRDVETKEVPLAKFDQKTVDMFRLMGSKSKKPTHFYPMAMVSYELCPPPDTIEAGVGEQRNVRYVPIGVSVGKEVENTGGKESRHLFTDHAMEAVEEDYQTLLKSIEEKAGEQ